MRIQSLITCLFTFWGMSAMGQLTLEECRTRSRANFPMIAQYDLIAQSQEYNLSNANKNYLPQFSITAIGGIIDGFPSFSPGGGSSSGSDFNLIGIGQINQVLWDGGITAAQKDMIRAQSQVDLAQLEVSIYQLDERVNDLYFSVLLFDEKLAQTELFMKNLDVQVNKVEKAIESGIAYASDLKEIQVEVINAEQSQLVIQYAREAYISMLSAMMGKEIPAETEFVAPISQYNPATASIQRPEIKAFDQQLAFIDAQRKMNKSNLYPKIGLIGFGTLIEPGVSLGISEIDHILVAGLNLTWDIGGLYRNGNNNKLEEVQRSLVENQKETFLYNTNLQLTQLFIEIQKYEQLLAQDQKITELKTSIAQAYQVKYDNGVATMTQLIERLNDENLAVQNQTVHEVQYLMALYKHQTTSGNSLNP